MDSIKDMKIEMAVLQHQVNDLEDQLKSIVRCKDCKYCSWKHIADGQLYCYQLYEVDADDFCSKGVKR